MTKPELKDLLQHVNVMIPIMDRRHSRKLLKILLDAQCKKTCAFFHFFDAKKYVSEIVSELLNKKNFDNMFTRWHIKRIYTIMGDYHYYPICGLCGMPIKIDSETETYTKRYRPLGFSWDHIKPKSLGGSNIISNMQPTHKICNNIRGNNISFRAHYLINVTCDVNIETKLSKKHRKRKNKYVDLGQQNNWFYNLWQNLKQRY